MKSKAPNKRKFLKWLKRLGLLVMLIFLVPTLLFFLGQSNKNLLINGLQEWYSINNNGHLEIGKVDANFLSGFPNISFTLNDIRQTNFDTILDKKTSIFIDKARVRIGAKNLLKANIQFKNIDINHAEITSEVVSEKSVADYIRIKEQTQENLEGGFKMPAWLHPKKTVFRLRDVKFISKDTMLNKYFNLEIRNVSGSIKGSDQNATGTIDFDVLVNKLGFNTNKGGYINGALVSGHPNFTLNKKKNTLDISEFQLAVGEENFTVNAEFDFNGATSYKFSFKNNKTNFQEIKSFLPDSLSAKLSAYEILKPFKTDLSLKGKFLYGNVPYLNANFITENNEARIGDLNTLENVDFQGYITNNFNKGIDSLIKKPARPDIKVFFKDFTANLEDINIKASDAYYQASEEIPNLVNAKVQASGSNETLARVLQNDNFNFVGGNFNFQAHINGNISHAHEILNSSSGNFTMQNTRVVLQKNKLQLPVELIELGLDNEISVLKNLKINLPNGENLVFEGTLKNASSLLTNTPINPTSANVSLDSEELDLNELINTAMEFMPETDKNYSDLKTLHETFATIFYKFHPGFELNLDKLKYNEITFRNVSANVQLIDPETVLFDDLNFHYKESVTNLNGTIKVPEPGNAVNEPIFIDVETNASGPLKVFQDLFKIELVRINSGDFKFSGNITGNIQKFEQILDSAKGDLKLLNARFYYPNAGKDIAFDSLKIAVDKSNINIDKFQLEVGEHHPFSLTAKIKKFTGFLMDNLENNGSVYLELEAPYVDMDQWMETVSSIETEENKEPPEKRDLTSVFSDIYEFHPEFILAVDSLKYRDLLTRNIDARVYFENDSILRLDDLQVKYGSSSATIKGYVAARNNLNSVGSENPFNFNFSAEVKGQNRDLNDFLKTVNFVFTSGDFKFNGNYQGEARDLNIFNSNAQGELSLGKSIVDIQAADIKIPVDSLHLNIKNNLATVDRLDINLPGKSSLNIKGSIDNFSNFINNDQLFDSHRSSFEINSPYLSNKDIEKLLESTGKDRDSSASKDFKIQNLKEILSAIYTSYYPSVNLGIDSLLFNNIAVSDFGSEIGFQKNGDFILKNTELKYFGGSVNLMVTAGVENTENLPVRIKMDAKDINIEKLVKDLDYFKDKDLREAEKVDGSINFVLHASGILQNDGNLNTNSLNGTLQIDITDLSLFNYKPIMEKSVLMKDERFEKLRFRPIKQTFGVKDGKIIIPRTQIQSSALQLFVEGELRLGDYVNIWLALPWNNLKSRDGLTLPEKISYENSGSKFYIQLIQDKQGDKADKQKLKTKFRLGNGKMKKSFEE